MKQATKRILSALLVLCMVLSILPTGVFAASEKTITANFTYYMKERQPTNTSAWTKPPIYK